MALLKVRSLKVHYPIKNGILGSTSGWLKAVDSVSFSIEPGQTMGIVGASGSGKSSIAKAILGLTKTTSGVILLKGKDITKPMKKNRSPYRRSIQMLFQNTDASFNPRKKILDILAEPLRNFEKLTKAEESKRIDEVLSLVGLTNKDALKYPHELSEGQRLCIGLGRAIALKPKLIIADDPLSVLDISVQVQILEYFKAIQENFGIAYLFFSRDLSIACHICSHLAILHNARFVEYGIKNDICKNPAHIYTKRLLAAIPDINPNNKTKNAEYRAAIETEYADQRSHYYKKNGIGVYNLKPLSDTHFAALP